LWNWDLQNFTMNIFIGVAENASQTTPVFSATSTSLPRKYAYRAFHFFLYEYA
jgi:hypothetical protein